MKKAILLIIVCTINISAFAQTKPKIKGDKNVITVNNKIISGFNAIEVDDEIELKIYQAQENSYTINADTNLHSVVHFAVHDSVLKIYTTHKITRSKKLDIWLNFINLEQITLKNNAEIESENTIDCDTMKISAHNSSKFNLDVMTKELEVSLYNNADGKISSRSKKTNIIMKDKADLEASISTDETTLTLSEYAQIKLSGDSGTANYIIKDNSELQASTIKNTSVNLTASDNTRSYLYTSKNFSLFAKGSAVIFLYGEPQIEIQGFTEKAQLIKK